MRTWLVCGSGCLGGFGALSVLHVGDLVRFVDLISGICDIVLLCICWFLLSDCVQWLVVSFVLLVWLLTALWFGDGFWWGDFGF